MYFFAFAPSGVTRGGQVGTRATRRRPWGRINTLFSHLKTRNLDQAMPKNAYFSGKKL